jgi:crossover junction endonuclease EME1
MAIELGPYPFDKFKTSLGAKLSEYGSKVSALSADLPPELKSGFRNLVTWKRNIKAIYNEPTKEYEPLPVSKTYWRRENTYMLYFTASDIFSHGENVKAILDRLRRVLSENDTHTRQNTNGKARTVRLMIMVDGWMRYKGKSEERRKLERMFVRLQMERCSIVHVEGQEDAVTWFYNLTADLGMKPHKLSEFITRLRFTLLY